MNRTEGSDDTFPPLVFGIYPGGACPGPPKIPDDPGRIRPALARLQGLAGRPFRVRWYVAFDDGVSPDVDVDQLLRESGLDPGYLTDGRRLDLVLAFQSKRGDVDGYVSFVRRAVRQLRPRLDAVQITEEPNARNNGGYVDGDMPNVREALVAGVLAAKDEAQRGGGDGIQVGFNVIPSFDENDDFAASLARLGGRPWARAVDYVGLDCFPGVWVQPPPNADGTPGDLGAAVVFLLGWMRERLLPSAGLPAQVPIVLAENGWATGPERPPERQAEVLERVIRAVSDHRARFNVRGYTLFDLRDRDSSDPDLFAQFGILHDDYTPKPAFEVYRRLIAELGGHG